jgi:DNA modification methylase
VIQRRALTNVGGDIDLGGDPAEAERLARALDVPVPTRSESSEAVTGREHVHGFHAYPARMHPATASRLVSSFVPEGGVVLDPFCGSGTVLVEAMILGRSAIGTDLNPLAVALSTLKTEPRTKRELAELTQAAKAVSAFAEARRKERVGATQRYPEVDVAAFDPHVLLELDGLRHGIYTLAPEARRRDLLLVLSAILVKVSRKESDTGVKEAPKRIAAGYTARLFAKKTDELVARLEALQALVKPRSPAPRVTVDEDDALRLSHVRDRSVDAVVTSPPYVATYDYLEHHAMRLRWLDMDASAFAAAELGSRREYGTKDARAAWDQWVGQLHALLLTLARVTRPGGAVVLLMADSAVRDTPLPAEDVVADAAGETGLVCVARASQPRPHFHQATRDAFRTRVRAEHALLLRR